MVGEVSHTRDQRAVTRDAPLHLWNYKAHVDCLIGPLGQPWKIVRLIAAFSNNYLDLFRGSLHLLELNLLRN